MQENKKERPIYFYVANLGSEVQRILVWKEKGDMVAMQNAYKRALSIIDTIQNFGDKSANTEMGILKNFLDSLVTNVAQSIDRNQISEYFNPFALRVMAR